MSHRHLREDNKTNGSNNLPVVSKCLAIVLISKSLDLIHSKDIDEGVDTIVDVTNGNVIVQSPEVRKAISPNGYNGKELLQYFKLRNKTCYWNPSLVESIKSLEYKGFMEPSTIFVTGADIHLENLRSAWGRRVLKAPAGFEIKRIGDVNSIQMQVIPQTQFMPLPDALCSIVMDLNIQQIMATWDVIVEKLAVWYKDMTMPDRQLLFETLSGLIRDRKIFHTGSGYFVVTPDTNRLANGNNSSFMPTNASWLPYHPMYVPVFQGQNGGHMPTLPPFRSQMRSISCQVTTIEETDESEGEESEVRVRSSGLTRESRSQSLKRITNTKRQKDGKGAEKIEIDHNALKRSSSLKHRLEKEKALKEISPEPAKRNVEMKKSKGDKPSLFSKIFGRNKKKISGPSASALMPPPPPPPPPSVRSRIPLPSDRCDASNAGKESKGKEYATFSAQFPPPEWTWYQQQLDKQKRVETWVSQLDPVARHHQLPTKSLTQPQATGTHTYGLNDYTHHPNQTTRKSMLSLHNQQSEYLPMSIVGGNIYNKNNLPSANKRSHTAEFGKPQSISPDNFYEIFRNPIDPVHHRKSKSRNQLKEKAPKHQSSQPQPSRLNGEKRQSVYDFIDQADVTPLHTSNVYNSVSGLSPVGHLSEGSVYGKLSERHDLGPLHSTPCAPASHTRNKTERMSHGVDGHEARDRIYGPPHDHLKRKSHNFRRRSHKAYSYYGHGDDISYEYKGHLPNKNSSRAQSRDSGVNCVGLTGTANQGKKRSGHVYENTSTGNHKGHHRHNDKPSERSHTVDDHVRFDVTNDAALSINAVADMNEITDPAFSSVVYGMNSLIDHHGLSEVGGFQNRRNESEMVSTMSGFATEFSQLPPPYSSLQSDFYEDSSHVQLCANLVTCEVEINPKAPSHTRELAFYNSVIDVENLTGVREVAGSSDEVMRSVTDKVNTISVSHSADNYEARGKTPSEDSNRIVEKMCNDANSETTSSHNDIVGNSNVTLKQCNDKDSSSQLLKTEIIVADSGFSSPRNTDDTQGQTSSQSHCSEHSGTQSQTENNDPHHHYEESAVSDSHQTPSSDVHMVSSEHNNGSANDNADLSAEDSSKRCPAPHKIRYKGSSQSLKSASSGDSKQSYSQEQLFHKAHHYSSSSKLITHPDVFNNNNNMTIAAALNGKDDGHHCHHLASIATHSNMINFDPRKYNDKRDRHHRMDIVALPSTVSSHQLHQFEEEQLSKKFGANGEYEVMGVL